MRIEFGLPRTACACATCVRNCKFMPGMIIPSDLDRMIENADYLKWAEENLLASPGAMVMRGSSIFRIPTLVPAVKENGHCKFLTADDKCSIHENAPFGCAFFDCGPERDQLSHKGLTTILKEWLAPESRYCEIWRYLFMTGHVQERAEVLREKMREL